MKKYTQYDTETGEILRFGTCPDELFDHATMIEGNYRDDLYYIHSGNAVAFPAKPSEFHIWDWANRTWEITGESLTNAKIARSTSIDTTCRETIYEGFSSSALGQEYHYSAKTTDQANLNASVTASLYPGLSPNWITPFWCERNGVWDYKMHTATQIQQVGVDGKTSVLYNLNKNAALQASIEDCTTVDEVQTITW